VRFRRKSKSVKVELLSGVSLFSACNRGELSRLAALLEEIDVPKGKVLTREGEPGWEFFVVAEGRAKAAIRGRKVASVGPGGFFGEMSLLDQGPRTATVTAETDMQLLVLDSRGFSAMIEETPMVARKILRGLAERLRGSEKATSH
jgi:CRP/FNR family cyclic AMP-dependent transcriptional regulator